MLTEEQIKEIEQTLECYEEADDMERRMQARFVIELHAPDWVGLFISDIRALQHQNKKLIETLQFYADKKHYTDGQANVHEGDILDSSIKWDEGEKARDALQQIRGNQEP